VSGINPYIFRAYDVRGKVGIDITPEVFAERQKADLAYWKRMIDYTGIKVE